MNKLGVAVATAMTVLASLVIGNKLQAQITPPGGGGGGGTNTYYYTNSFSSPPYMPGLKLAIPPPVGTNLFINLLEADPAGTYDIFAASNLAYASWNDVLDGTNGQTNFTLPIPFAGAGFFRVARTDTPVVDTAGMTASFPNNDVNTNLTSAVISGGPAAALAVLVNDTNLADAVWIPFSAVPNVLLGTNDGTYSVTFGFIGSDGQTNWTTATVTLDTAPTSLVITNLSSLSGSRPFIDPAGYSTKALSSLTFDVTDADGTITHDQAIVTDQDCNPADMSHTTNHFVCLDVALALGTNFIGISAVDWAGNVTTTNFSYIFDTNGDTTPPAVSLTWPQDGMEVSGTNFTLRGMLDDDTATVSGQWTDTNGVTNIVSGLVERGGQFWLQNLPLNPGTNLFTVAATDAAGNVTLTNLSLIQSSVALTMDAVDAAQLNQVQVNVTGEISDPTYAVWVNGVQGTNNGDGTWAANNVPVTSGGTASFDLTAYPPAYAPTGDSWTNFATEQGAYPNPFPADPAQAHVDWDKPPVVYVKANKFEVNYYEESPYNGYYTSDDTQSWAQGGGGYRNINGNILDQWPGDAGDVPVVPGLGSCHLGSVIEYTNLNIGTPNVEWIDSANSSGVDWGESDADDIIPIIWAATGGQVVELFTGGKAMRQVKNLFALNQTLTQLQYSIWANHGLYVGGIAPQEIALGGYGKLGADGNLYTMLADGQNVVITPKAPGNWYGGGLPGQQKYKLRIVVNGTNPLWPDHVPAYNRYCVGQYLGFDQEYTPALPSGTQLNPIQWALDGTYVNTNIPAQFSDGSSNYSNNPALLSHQSTYAWWIDGSYNPTNYKATLGEGLTFPNGQYVAVATHGLFTMHRPRIFNYVANTNSISEGLWHSHEPGTAAPLEGVGLIPGTEYEAADWLGCFYGPEYNLEVDTLFVGNAFVTQTLNGFTTNQIYSSYYSPGDYLDWSVYYGDKFHETNNNVLVVPGGSLPPLHFEDAPEILCFSNTTQHEHFTDYICFQPEGGIPVTLGIVTWHCDGDSYKTTIPGTTNQDYYPFATADQAFGDYGYIAPTGHAQFDTFTTDHTLANWVHNTKNIHHH